MIWVLILGLLLAGAEALRETQAHSSTRPVMPVRPLGAHPGPALCRGPGALNKAASGCFPEPKVPLATIQTNPSL